MRLNLNIAGLLGVAFVVLKLLEEISWSWWYVTLPFWGGIALVLSILCIPLLLITAILVIEKLSNIFNTIKEKINGKK